MIRVAWGYRGSMEAWEHLGAPGSQDPRVSGEKLCWGVGCSWSCSWRCACLGSIDLKRAVCFMYMIWPTQSACYESILDVYMCVIAAVPTSGHLQLFHAESGHPVLCTFKRETAANDPIPGQLLLEFYDIMMQCWAMAQCLPEEHSSACLRKACMNSFVSTCVSQLWLCSLCRRPRNEWD